MQYYQGNYRDHQSVSIFNYGALSTYHMLVVSTPVSGLHLMYIIMHPGVYVMSGLDPNLDFFAG